MTLDDNYATSPSSAKFLIVEPKILIPTTQLVKAHPCVRKAYISHLFNDNKDINYALVLGVIVHEVFQEILQKMDFQHQALDSIVR